MKPVWRYSLFALCAYLLFMLILFPADRIYSLLHQRGILVLPLYQVSGSIWQGHVGRARIAGLDVNDLDWCLRPWALFLGRLEAGVNVATGDEPLAVVIGRKLDGSYYVHNGNGALSIPVLESVFAARPYGITGTLDLDLKDIRLQSGQLQSVTGELRWRQAGLGAPLGIELGNFELSLVSSDGTVQGTLKDIGGPLQAEGQLVLQANNNYRLNMTLASRDGKRSDLRQALSLLGTPSPDGRISLTFNGRLENIAAMLQH